MKTEDLLYFQNLELLRKIESGEYWMAYNLRKDNSFDPFGAFARKFGFNATSAVLGETATIDVPESMWIDKKYSPTPMANTILLR